MPNVVDVQLSGSARTNGTGIAVDFVPAFVEICYFLMMRRKRKTQIIENTRSFCNGRTRTEKGKRRGERGRENLSVA